MSLKTRFKSFLQFNGSRSISAQIKTPKKPLIDQKQKKTSPKTERVLQQYRFKQRQKTTKFVDLKNVLLQAKMWHD